jgi:predicted dehydrogenase
MSESEKNGSEASARPSRRDFFKMAGAAGAVVGTLSSSDALAAPLPAPRANPKRFVGGRFPKASKSAKGRVLGANDRIQIAVIGVGGMGNGHLQNLLKNKKDWNIQPMAISDVYVPRIDRARGKILEGDPEGVTVQTEKDYRRILENKDVDAVIVATPEHWHAQIAVHAMEAGKHVYIEKPMTRYLDEAFQVYDAWKKTGMIVQVGSQGTSDPKYHAAREVVTSGRLGPLVSAQSSYTRNKDGGEWNYEIEADAGPSNLDWQMWLGSAPKRPWNEDSKARFFRYRKYRDYSGGILGDLMPHRIHPLLMAMGGKDWPLRVQCLGTMKIHTDREVSDSVYAMAEMSGGWTFMFVGSTVNEQGLPEVVRGNRASMYLAGKEPEVKPERPYAEEIEGGAVVVNDSGESHVKHEKNWLESIRNNKQPNCDMELSIRTQTLVSLTEISEVSGRTVTFDIAKRTWKFA